MFAFDSGSSVVSAWPEEGVSPETLTDTFYRQLQPIIFQANGWQALHASSCVTPDGLLILCGRAHSGKSTYAFGLARRGYPQFGDDQLIWRPTADGFEAWPMPFRPRLRHPARRFFRDVQPDHAPPSAPTPSRFARIVILNQSAGVVPLLSEVPGPTAFTQLLGFAHFFNPTDRDEASRLVRDYSTLVERVPVLSFAYEPDFAQFESMLDVLLDTPRRLTASRP